MPPAATQADVEAAQKEAKRQALERGQTMFKGVPLLYGHDPAATVKAGRVLSQRNVDRLNDVHDNLIELEKMELPKTAKVMCKDCRLTLKAVMDEASTPEADVPEDKASEPKAAPITTEAAIQCVLSSDPVVLKRVRDAADAMLEVQKSDKQVAQYRKATKRTPAPSNGSAGK